jgi:hypothetical protein
MTYPTDEEGGLRPPPPEFLDALMRRLELDSPAGGWSGVEHLGSHLDDTARRIEESNEMVNTLRADPTKSIERSIGRVLHVAIFLREYTRASAATAALTDPAYTREYILRGLNRAVEELISVRFSLNIEQEKEEESDGGA